MSGRLLRERTSAKPAYASESTESLLNDYLSSNNLFVQNGMNSPSNPNTITAKPINENHKFDFFQQQQQKLLYQQQNNTKAFNYTGIPGHGHQTVDVIKRIEMSLQCGIADETRWALVELTKLTHQTPLTVNLKDQSFLTDSLVRFYANCPFIRPEVSEKVGIPFLMQNADRELGYADIENAVDSALILRNLSQDSSNAYLISQNELLKSSILKFLSCDLLANDLPIGETYNSVMKFFQFTIDIVESITSYISPASKDDQLFLQLMKILQASADRGIMISILRSLSRLLVRSKVNAKERYAAENVDSSLLDFACYCLLMENDAEFIITGLDFLYQYILPGSIRISNLLRSAERVNLLVETLPKLLKFKIKPEITGLDPEALKESLKLATRVKIPPPESAKFLPPEIYKAIDKLNEPQRATMWMRCCFRANPKSDVTQISLWKSYELQFQNESKKLLPAVDFIKNVTNAFVESAAMVITNPETNQRKFIIKGIEPRPEPVSTAVVAQEFSNLKNSEKDNEKAPSPSKQKEVKLWTGVDNPKIYAISDIGKNAAMFINGLMVQEKGKALVKLMERDLVDVVVRVPQLMEILSDTLTSISQIV